MPLAHKIITKEVVNLIFSCTICDDMRTNEEMTKAWCNLVSLSDIMIEVADKAIPDWCPKRMPWKHA